MIKQYSLLITVDTEQLIKSYTGNDNTVNQEDLPLTDELVAFELNWCVASGIEVKEINEVNKRNENNTSKSSQLCSS